MPSASFVNFSQGGGAIRLEVAGTLTVNGAVTANGKAALFQNTGGGAGGSVWLNVGTLSGNGAITANGGAGEPVNGGGGGGGRVALYYLTDNFTGVATASGAARGFARPERHRSSRPICPRHKSYPNRPPARSATR